MKDKSIAISEIEIKIGDKVLKLSLEQAKNLRDILCETFPTPQPHWQAPVVIERPVYIPRHVYPQWEITCGTDSQRRGQNGRIMCLSAASGTSAQLSDS